jgi:hypothetical protein
MIPHIDDHIPAFDDPAQEREWLAQEQAMRRERLQLDPAGDDARSRRYRLLARTLREPLPDALPADFARQVAARVAPLPARQGVSARSLESVLTLVLGIALGVAAVAAAVIYGSAWLPSFVMLLPHPQTSAIHWLLALAGCLGASWLLGHWQRHAPH